jgi:orotidine-5'-phosphate decarboxylase
MDADQLFERIKSKQSFLCLGLDTDIEKIPEHLLAEEDPVFEFNRQILDATSHLIVACKPNLAFYESLGPSGLQSLQKTVEYIRSKFPDMFLIADAKRGDIGNTSLLYAKAFFESMDFDAVTLSPYMGSDSIVPYLSYPDKWVILLALTSNPGSSDFQLLGFTPGGERLYESVLREGSTWGSVNQIMFVVGATHPNLFEGIRTIVPDHFILVPGLGAQGGDLAAIAKHGLNRTCGLLVNASRTLIYASPREDFARKARDQAERIQQEMASILKQHRLID